MTQKLPPPGHGIRVRVVSVAHVPLLEEHPRPLQFVFVFVAPVAFGAITGYFLGVSEITYLVLSVLGVLGGIGAGYDHVGARAGALRGVIAGALFGGSILVAHEIHGAEPKAHLPQPEILLVAVTTILAIAFGALGGWLRARSLRGPPAPPQQAAVAPPPAPPPAAGGLISLTHGSFEEYRGLGMSVTQANRVIAFRERGGYSSVDDLGRVPGFSRQFLAELKQKLTA